MLSRWWAPRRGTPAVVYVRLRCMPIYVVWLLVLFPSSRKAGISPPLSADIPARVRRYLRPHSAISPPFFLRFSSLSPLFLLSFWSLSPLFYLSSNLRSIPVQLLFRIVRREVFFLHSTPSVHFLTAASPLFLFYFRQFPAQSAPVMSIKRIKSLHLNDLS